MFYKSNCGLEKVCGVVGGKVSRLRNLLGIRGFVGVPAGNAPIYIGGVKKAYQKFYTKKYTIVEMACLGLLQWKAIQQPIRIKSDHWLRMV